MSTDWIQQLVEQMTTERSELIARQALIDGALDAIKRVYPGAFSATVVRAAVIDTDGSARELDLDPAPVATPALPINNRKPRVKTNGKATKEPAPAAAPPVRAESSLTAYDQATLEVLKANNGLTTTEVADKMGLTCATAWSRLRRLKDAGLAAAGADKFWRSL